MTRKNRFTTVSILSGSRPERPARLRPDMAAEWRRAVGRMPAGWFGLEHLPVLEEYCRNVCYARNLAAWLDNVDPTTLGKEELARYRFLSSRYDRCAGLMALLANRCRLTVISRAT
jgi:hypothetical protein